MSFQTMQQEIEALKQQLADEARFRKNFERRASDEMAEIDEDLGKLTQRVDTMADQLAVIQNALASTMGISVEDMNKKFPASGKSTVFRSAGMKT